MRAPLRTTWQHTSDTIGHHSAHSPSMGCTVAPSSSASDSIDLTRARAAITVPALRAYTDPYTNANLRLLARDPHPTGTINGKDETVPVGKQAQSANGRAPRDEGEDEDEDEDEAGHVCAEHNTRQRCAMQDMSTMLYHHSNSPSMRNAPVIVESVISFFFFCSFFFSQHLPPPQHGKGGAQDRSYPRAPLRMTRATQGDAALCTTRASAGRCTTRVSCVYSLFILFFILSFFQVGRGSIPTLALPPSQCDEDDHHSDLRPCDCHSDS